MIRNITLSIWTKFWQVSIGWKVSFRFLVEGKGGTRNGRDVQLIKEICAKERRNPDKNVDYASDLDALDIFIHCVDLHPLVVGLKPRRIVLIFPRAFAVFHFLYFN
jgi:hypothetical protein